MSNRQSDIIKWTNYYCRAIIAYGISYLRIKYKLFRPKNLIITGKIQCGFKVRLAIDKSSKIVISGNFRVKKSNLYFKGSDIKLNDCDFSESKCQFIKSQVTSTGRLKVAKSNWLVTESNVQLEGVLEESVIKCNKAELNTGKGFQIIGSQLTVLSSVFQAQESLVMEHASVQVEKQSEFHVKEYIKISRNLHYQANIFVSAGKFETGSNIRVQCVISCIGGNFSTGDNVFLNHGTEIRCFKQITLGSNIFISYEAVVFDNNSHSLNPSKRIKEITQGFPNNTLQTDDLKPKSKEILIGNNCWVGMRAAILKGAVLKENAIVALGSVVTGLVPENHYAYGNPAVVKQISDSNLVE